MFNDFLIFNVCAQASADNKADGEQRPSRRLGFIPPELPKEQDLTLLPDTSEGTHTKAVAEEPFSYFDVNVASTPPMLPRVRDDVTRASYRRILVEEAPTLALNHGMISSGVTFVHASVHSFVPTSNLVKTSDDWAKERKTAKDANPTKRWVVHTKDPVVSKTELTTYLKDSYDEFRIVAFSQCMNGHGFFTSCTQILCSLWRCNMTSQHHGLTWFLHPPPLLAGLFSITNAFPSGTMAELNRHGKRLPTMDGMTSIMFLSPELREKYKANAPGKGYIFKTQTTNSGRRVFHSYIV